MNWLPQSHLKNISITKIIYEYPVGQLYGGYCDFSNRKIVVVYSDDILHEASTLAHEFRHWVQYEHNLGKFSGIRPRSDISYEEMIKWYFLSDKMELNALLYQNKYAKSDTSDWWLRKLCGMNNDYSF